jgi:hypothetical protein
MTQQAKRVMPATQAHARKEASTGGATAKSIGADVVRNIGDSTAEVQKAQDKLLKIGSDAAEQLVRSADKIPQMMTASIDICRANAEASIECLNIISEAVEDVSNEVMQSYNRSAEECADISKAAFGCRTINDVMELHNRMLKLGLDNCFNESSKLMTMGFECCTALLKPLHNHIEEASERINKVFTV